MTLPANTLAPFKVGLPMSTGVSSFGSKPVTRSLSSVSPFGFARRSVVFGSRGPLPYQNQYYETLMS
jgi:hypothetical protein